MTPIVVNLFAGPGAGKSTVATGVFSIIKLHNINAELVTEVAKDFTWEQRKKTLRNQYYVWAKQQHKFWRVKDEVDIIVTDSPLFFSLIYGERKPDSFYELVINEFNVYNNMNYFLMREKPYQAKGRNESEDEAKNIDGIIEYKLNTNNIKYKKIHGGISGINEVVKDVMDKMGKKSLIYLSGNGL